MRDVSHLRPEVSKATMAHGHLFMLACMVGGAAFAFDLLTPGHIVGDFAYLPLVALAYFTTSRRDALFLAIAATVLIVAAHGFHMIDHAVRTDPSEMANHAMGIMAVWFVALLVSQLRQAEAKARDAEQHFRDVAESAADWVWAMDADLRFTEVGHQIKDAAGVDPATLIGKRRDELAIDAEADLVAAHMDDLANRRAFKDFRYRIRREDGEPCYLKISGRPVFSEDGTFMGFRGAGSDETPEMRALDRARKAEARLAEAIEAMTEGFALYDADDRLVICNTRYRELYAESASFMAPGAKFEDILRGGVSLGQYEEAIGQEEEWVAERMAAHHTPGSAVEQKLANGRWVLVHERHLSDGSVAGIRTDITEIKLREEEARLSEAKLRAVIEGITDAIFVKGVDGHYTLVNGAYTEFYGLEPEQIIGKTNEAVYPPNQATVFTESDNQIIKTGKQERFERHMTLAGQDRHFTTIKSPVFGADGTITGLVGVTRDITERKQSESDLRVAKRSAEQASIAKSEFLARMSHELRTPLNAIIGFSETIRDQVLGPIENARYLDYANDILTSGHHLLSLINDVLDLSKIEAGRYELEEFGFDLANAIDPAVRMVRDRAESADIVLDFVVPDQPLRVYADRRALTQVFINLLSNAIKFTPHGGRVEVSTRRVNGGGLEVRVSDNGIGISKTDAEKVMESFSQAGNVMSRKHEGTGLGLPIAKSLIELHGGRLILDSELGAGTEVRFTLPESRVMSAHTPLTGVA